MLIAVFNLVLINWYRIIPHPLQAATCQNEYFSQILSYLMDFGTFLVIRRSLLIRKHTHTP